MDSETYEVDYSDDLDNYAPASIEISEPVQLVRNTNSGETNSPPVEGELTAPSGDEISGEVIIITEPSTGDYITIK